MYEWDFGWVWTYRQALLDAFIVTIRLNLWIVVIGSLAGMGIALARRSRSSFLRVPALIYIDLFRTLPILVLLVWFFFCVPVLLGGIRLSAWLSAIIVLSLNLSAFVAEIVRAGIESVPIQHIEAARVCGLSRARTFRYVELPIALRNMVPPLVGQYINTIKLSVLASVIAVPELLHKTTDIISQVYRPLEFYTVLALLFLVLLLPGTIWSRRLEARAHLGRMSAEG
jgi:polar amino acid transport system permease protein